MMLRIRFVLSRGMPLRTTCTALTLGTRWPSVLWTSWWVRLRRGGSQSSYGQRVARRLRFCLGWGEVDKLPNGIHCWGGCCLRNGPCEFF